MAALLDLARRHLNHPDPSVRDAAADLQAAEIARIMNEDSMAHIPAATFNPEPDEPGSMAVWGALFALVLGVIVGGLIVFAGKLAGVW
jgi:hypothetical protein